MDPGAEAETDRIKSAVNGKLRRRYSHGYSRFVSAMKFILPAVAFLLIVLVVAWPYLKAQHSRFRLGFTDIKLEDGDDPAMLNPRYLGTDKSSQPYSITADLAKNLLKESASVELEMPKADITLEDGSWLVLTAETGVYGRGEKTLILVGAVNLFHDSGYEFRTDEAQIDLNEGIAYGKSPVEGQGPFGDLQGEGFRLARGGKTIYFTGKSRLVIYPGIGKPPAGKG
ncbi:MAG: hypothetical protein A3G18_06125 [Rhodospirillales bacterium RIFCSPLOWO2_12_FULL_58_28]|nr:MAG: hypothetical protein A3H92_03965 [Rhodospirillales bacterium RIFCSPLOWO2_02_FULL_58_16]OHC80001.1 MAG: hypothetical protein A3G18_06125 [Rhodospirillales bacterium RIFCSPLOWO2_12_FULL_58_28]